MNKVLNYLSHSSAILVMMVEIEASKTGASLQLEAVSWNRFLRRVCMLWPTISLHGGAPIVYENDWIMKRKNGIEFGIIVFGLQRLSGLVLIISTSLNSSRQRVPLYRCWLLKTRNPPISGVKRHACRPTWNIFKPLIDKHCSQVAPISLL